MLNPVAYDNAAPAGVAVLECAPIEGQPAPIPFVPLQRTTVNGRWDGPLAEITITHAYGYTRAQCDRVLEAIYRFPLPGDAAVRRCVVTFGEVEIVAELRERGQAEAAYEEAKRQGRQAALTTREAPDAFTLRVAGLQPDQQVVVETTYVQLADVAGIGWTLRIPLVTAPRYVRGDEPHRRRRQSQPLATLRDPGHRFALDLTAGLNGTITSATHALRISDEDDHARVQLAQGELIPDRDCVLAWMPAQAPDAPTLRVLTSADPAGAHLYFAALVSPPARPLGEAAPCREAIVLVDHSGSMDGAKRQAADQAALGFIRDLGAGDTFNLGVFHSTSRWLSGDPLPAGPDAARRAEAFLQAEQDGGGTELGVALEQALTQRRARGDASRQVVIITDAQVSDEARILRMVEEDATQVDRRRISVLCIDAAPNDYLTRQLALLGGGIARFLTSAPAEGDMAAALKDILAGWSQPVAVGLRLEINRASAETSDGRRTAGGPRGRSSIDLGDLTTGRSLWVVGRAPAGDGDMTFALVGADGHPLAARATPEQVRASGALKAVFGAWRIQGLERLVEGNALAAAVRAELARLGYDAQARPAQRRAVYAENAARADAGRLKDLLLREALDYGLLCSVTGFVAVRKEKGQPVQETAIVGSALPQGWSEGFASGAPAALYHREAALPLISRLRTDPLEASCLIDLAAPEPGQPGDDGGDLEGTREAYTRRRSAELLAEREQARRELTAMESVVADLAVRLTEAATQASMAVQGASPGAMEEVLQRVTHLREALGRLGEARARVEQIEDELLTVTGRLWHDPQERQRAAAQLAERVRRLESIEHELQALRQEWGALMMRMSRMLAHAASAAGDLAQG